MTRAAVAAIRLVRAQRGQPARHHDHQWAVAATSASFPPGRFGGGRHRGCGSVPRQPRAGDQGRPGVVTRCASASSHTGIRVNIFRAVTAPGDSHWSHRAVTVRRVTATRRSSLREVGPPCTGMQRAWSHAGCEDHRNPGPTRLPLDTGGTCWEGPRLHSPPASPPAHPTCSGVRYRQPMAPAWHAGGSELLGAASAGIRRRPATSWVAALIEATTGTTHLRHPRPPEESAAPPPARRPIRPAGPTPSNTPATAIRALRIRPQCPPPRQQQLSQCGRAAPLRHPRTHPRPGLGTPARTDRCHLRRRRGASDHNGKGFRRSQRDGWSAHHSADRVRTPHGGGTPSWGHPGARCHHRSWFGRARTEQRCRPGAAEHRCAHAVPGTHPRGPANPPVPAPPTPRPHLRGRVADRSANPDAGRCREPRPRITGTALPTAALVRSPAVPVPGFPVVGVVPVDLPSFKVPFFADVAAAARVDPSTPVAVFSGTASAPARSPRARRLRPHRRRAPLIGTGAPLVTIFAVGRAVAPLWPRRRRCPRPRR